MDKCPICHGVPTHPEVEGCHGCDECDYSGTLAGYELMKKKFHEAMEAMDESEKNTSKDEGWDY